MRLQEQVFRKLVQVQMNASTLKVDFTDFFVLSKKSTCLSNINSNNVSLTELCWLVPA